ncbi:hypothetical protein A8A54_11025 [Brucella pseudogrignonensis]|nr:hypothetical protein A8A54_11025 [Brucella pseudogrignonensis]
MVVDAATLGLIEDVDSIAQEPVIAEDSSKACFADNPKNIFIGRRKSVQHQMAQVWRLILKGFSPLSSQTRNQFSNTSPQCKIYRTETDAKLLAKRIYC